MARAVSVLRAGLRRLARVSRRAAAAIAESAEPVSMPPPGARSARLGDPSRETSTNAQMEGAAGEPWGGNR
jgi:hypothetical protein